MYGLLHGADAARRQHGMLLEQLGYGPVTTPSRTVRQSSVADLIAYQDGRSGPAVLVVPAPIKAPYIWDLDPAVSAVRRLMEAGLQVYLICWRRPPADVQLGLAAYADTAIRECVDAVRDETVEQRVVLAGHSIGGTMAAIFASLHAERVRALLELEGPMAFGEGVIEALLSGLPRSATAALSMEPTTVPGTLLDWASLQADPLTFAIEPWVDLLASGSDPDRLRLHWQVRRWTLDETPMAAGLLDEVATVLYRENRFAEGRLDVGGQLAAPAAITAPVLGVLDPASRLVPPGSIEAYRRRTASTEVLILPYAGDRGVVMQHVGVLVGRNAHRTLWPRITSWLRSLP